MTNRAYDPLTCPMPECVEDLYARFENTQALYRGTLDDRQPLKAGDGDVSSWTVECVSGHVILVPRPAGCRCVHRAVIARSEETKQSSANRKTGWLPPTCVGVAMTNEFG